MKRTIIGISMLSSALIFGAHWAAQPTALANTVGTDGEEVGVGRGARLPRIAITADGKLGEVLRKNAALSSGFEVIERKSIPSSLVRSAVYDPSAWASVGADVVVIVDSSGPQLKIRMFEERGGKKATLSKAYPANNPLKAADKFMNDVVERFTNERGVFGSRIAYVRTRRDPRVSKNVQTVEMNGEAPSAVTSNRSLNVLPSIGPGGEVLFTSYAKRNPDLWMSSGGGPKRVSSFSGLNTGGVMSPTGASIAVTLSKDGNPEIYTLSRSGAVKARLTKNKAIDVSPSWGPGGQLAFASNRGGGVHVYSMSGGGGGSKRLTKSGSYNQTPDWCPEKSCAEWIVYAGRDGSNRFDIFKVSTKTGETKRLTQSSGRNLDPSWSPDGRLIAYSKEGGIFVANDEGNNQIKIARGGTSPDWGPRVEGY